MPMLNTLKKSGRAALLALTLGAATVGTAAMPTAVQAQEFNFRLGIGNDGSGMSFNFGNSNDRRHFRPITRCLTNNQVIRGLRHYGFRNAEIHRNFGRNVVAVIAEYRGRDYSMRVDRCTGEVYNVQRLRNHRGHPGFQFNFRF